MKFLYIARTQQGRLQSGEVEAGDQKEALAVLQNNNLVVVDLQKIGRMPLIFKNLTIFGGVKKKDVVMFSRQLATMFSAKVPIIQALTALANQTKSPVFRETIFRLAEDIEGGSMLSRALEKFPKAFSDFYVNMVRSGEAAGNLENSLNYLADHLEKEQYLIRKVTSAMYYPIFILVGFAGVVVVLLVMVIPQLTSILEETGQQLPWTTRFIIGLSVFVKNYGIFVAIFLAISAGVLFKLTRKGHGRYILDKFKINIPLVGILYRKIYLARFSQNFATLIKGGLTIMRSFKVVADTMGNMIYRDIVLEAMEEVRVGGEISSVFALYPEVPSLVVQMLATGEKTGQLEKILQNVGTFYEKEVDATVEGLSQLIEPILIIFLGVGVAILVASILIPIYNTVGNM